MKNKGFSLIELLIVIAIMAILGSLGLAAYTTVRKEARDTQRKHELNQYKTALESYYAANSTYPSLNSSYVRNDSSDGIFDSTANLISKFMGGVKLQGPNSSEYYYYYAVDASDQNYKLWGEIEIPNTYPNADYWEICSNGKTGHVLRANISQDATCNPVTQ